MDVVVTGRHIELSERFRDHVADKLGKLEKHDHRIMRVQVEVENERNPRQADRAVRVELTAFSKGPVIRAEAAAVDKMGALDLAVDKMEPRCVAPTTVAARPIAGVAPTPPQSTSSCWTAGRSSRATTTVARSPSRVTARRSCARRPMRRGR